MQVHIVQRGAVGPLIEMLQSSDSQLREMSAFALGRLAQVNFHFFLLYRVNHYMKVFSLAKLVTLIVNNTISGYGYLMTSFHDLINKHLCTILEYLFKFISATLQFNSYTLCQQTMMLCIDYSMWLTYACRSKGQAREPPNVIALSSVGMRYVNDSQYFPYLHVVQTFQASFGSAVKTAVV